MLIHIDYLTFRIPARIAGAGAGAESSAAARRIIRGTFPDALASWILNLDYVLHPPKSGHARIDYNPTHHAALKYGGNFDYVWLELPGAACAALRDAGLLRDAIAYAHQYCRRIDIACDIGDHDPVEFVKAGHSGRFQSGSEWRSADGVTVYVGSMKSERYARVYRYAPPHPRADRMRVEYVYQGDPAPALAGVLHENGILGTAAALGEVFAWKHSAWNMAGAKPSSLPAMRQRKGDGARVRWIMTQAAPGIASAIAEGLLSHDEALQIIENALQKRLGAAATTR